MLFAYILTAKFYVMRSIILLFSVFLMVGCASNDLISKQTKQGKDFHELVKSKNFQIVSKWAQPLPVNSVSNLSALLPYNTNAAFISIVGQNHFYMKGQDIDASLPYYGELQMGKSYIMRNAGIVFKGLPDDYKEEYIEEKKMYRIQFDIEDEEEESFRVIIKLFPSLKARIFITSSHRTSINYTGEIRDI